MNVPSIDTRTITTQVLVNDGQTVVLGGILETTHRDDDDQGALPRAISRSWEPVQDDHEDQQQG